MAAEVQQRAEGQAGQGAQGQEQEVDGEEGGGSGSDSGGGSSSSESSSDWESADEEVRAWRGTVRCGGLWGRRGQRGLWQAAELTGQQQCSA